MSNQVERFFYKTYSWLPTFKGVLLLSCWQAACSYDPSRGATPRTHTKLCCTWGLKTEVSVYYPAGREYDFIALSDTIEAPRLYDSDFLSWFVVNSVERSMSLTPRQKDVFKRLYSGQKLSKAAKGMGLPVIAVRNARADLRDWNVNNRVMKTAREVSMRAV